MRTFSFFIHKAYSSTPSLVFEIASDEETVKRLAWQALAASVSSLAVEVRENDRLLFSLDRNGVSWPAHRSSGRPGGTAAVPLANRPDGRLQRVERGTVCVRWTRSRPDFQPQRERRVRSGARQPGCIGT